MGGVLSPVKATEITPETNQTNETSIRFRFRILCSVSLNMRRTVKDFDNNNDNNNNKNNYNENNDNSDMYQILIGNVMCMLLC